MRRRNGTLSESTNILQRIRELAVQSASGTYSSDDRTNLQAEVTQLTAQLKSAITGAKFNGVTLFGLIPFSAKRISMSFAPHESGNES